MLSKPRLGAKLACNTHISIVAKQRSVTEFLFLVNVYVNRNIRLFRDHVTMTPVWEIHDKAKPYLILTLSSYCVRDFDFSTRHIKAVMT